MYDFHGMEATACDLAKQLYFAFGLLYYRDRRAEYYGRGADDIKYVSARM